MKICILMGEIICSKGKTPGIRRLFWVYHFLLNSFKVQKKTIRIVRCEIPLYLGHIFVFPKQMLQHCSLGFWYPFSCIPWENFTDQHLTLHSNDFYLFYLKGRDIKRNRSILFNGSLCKCLEQIVLVQSKARSQNSVQTSYVSDRDPNIGAVHCCPQGARQQEPGIEIGARTSLHSGIPDADHGSPLAVC